MVRKTFFPLRAARHPVIRPSATGRTLRELYPHRYPALEVTMGKTHEQVRAELAEAVRTGDILANGDQGLTLRELFPRRYPAVATAMGKTREQVRAELAEAVRTGDILASGDQGLTLRELYPHRYEMADAKAGAVHGRSAAGARSARALA